MLVREVIQTGIEDAQPGTAEDKRNISARVKDLSDLGQLEVPGSLRWLAESYSRGTRLAAMAADESIQGIKPLAESGLAVVHRAEDGQGHILRIYEMSKEPRPLEKQLILGQAA